MKTFVLLLMLCVPFAAQDMPKQDDKDIPHPAPTFEINPQPEVPMPPLPVNPDTCGIAIGKYSNSRPCTQRLLLKA